MSRITTAADFLIAKYDRLPTRWRQSALPYALASIPIIIGSIFGLYFVMPLLVALTVALLYRLASLTDSFMFELDKATALYAITLPICSFISVWGFVLAVSGQHSMLNGVVGPYCLVLLLACAPAYRVKRDRKARRVRLRTSFSIIGLLAVLASATHITE